jgi:hypothetical protein
MVPHQHFAYDTVLKNLHCERPKLSKKDVDAPKCSMPMLFVERTYVMPSEDALRIVLVVVEG